MQCRHVEGPGVQRAHQGEVCRLAELISAHSGQSLLKGSFNPAPASGERQFDLLAG